MTKTTDQHWKGNSL